jgi:alpha-N-acetylglucosaminidase
MALHGINMPLALTGEEAIWQDVYKEMGFSDEELGTFFTGPAYFSWLWMGNIDGWGGPLPQHWMDSHKELQKKILAQERSLGMTTVLPAFTGHVPPSFGSKFPKSKLRKTNWGAGFNDVYILDASDSLFDVVGAKFMAMQHKHYGTDHFYSADTFNENVPPQNDSTFLSDISRKVYRSMADTDSAAVWVMQGWMFHYNDEFWRPEKIEALLAGVPDDRMMILDLYTESHPVWEKTNAYHGKPWLWNMLQNFGGNISMFGRMESVAKGPSEALHNPQSGKMQGIGLTPEGIEQNPALFALMLENVWQDQPIDVDSWLKSYATRRYGKDNEKIHEAWSILKNTVYNGGLTEGGPESIIVARPTFSPKGHRVLTELTYNNADLAKAWKLLVEVSGDFRGHAGFEYDLVDVTRQVLANYASPLQQRIAKAYHQHDGVSYAKYAAEYLELIDDMDSLLATRQEFLFGKWLHDARSWGVTPAEKDIYEFNARDVVTLWGDKDSELHEYSNRQWSGLLKTFYKPRWEQFFQYVSTCMKNKKAVDEQAFEKEIKTWEWNWVNQKGVDFPFESSGSAVDVANAMYAKYSPKILSPKP